MLVRVQGPAGTSEILDMGAGATLADLRARIAEKLGIASASQTLKAGFPPQLIAAAADTTLVFLLGDGAARVLVSSSATQAAPAAGSGRRKPQAVRRVVPGTTVGAALGAGLSASSSGTTGGADGSGGAPTAAGPPAAAPAAAKRKRGPKAPVAGAEEEEGDPLQHTLAAAAEEAKRAPGKAKGSGRPLTTEQLLTDFHYGDGSALQLAARGGGTSSSFLTEQAHIEHRITALTARKYELTADGAWLHATFKAVRKQVSEPFQLIERPQLRELVAAIGSRGSSSRRGTSTHLLSARELSTRSPALFWSLVRAFDGNIDAGVRELLSETA